MHQHKITFLGAALEVTGSCHLLQSAGRRVLLDCGMLQGGNAAKKIGAVDFDFDPASIDAVVLSHAHLDHSGALPKLVASGFSGPIFCTPGTARLLRVLLEDSLHLYLQDLQRQNLRRKRSGRTLLEQAYTDRDVATVIELCRPVPYCTPHLLYDGIKLQFHNAGHILGSAIVSLELGESASPTKTLVFSGDLGNRDTVLMPQADHIGNADVVLLESTYGNRNHKAGQETLNELKEIITRAEKDEGCLLIPAFAVGRTQELLFQLGCLYQQGELAGWSVYLDSPMATEVTSIYDQCRASLDPKDTEIMRRYGSMSLPEFLPSLHISRSVEDSIAINALESKVIVIAGSGMCTGGRIRHHFKHRIWRESTHIVFVGFQAEGTFGRKLVNGEKEVKLYGQTMQVNAQIHTLGGFSAHADQAQLIDWVSAIKGTAGRSPHICLVHGEAEAVTTLSELLQDQYELTTTIAVKHASHCF